MEETSIEELEKTQIQFTCSICGRELGIEEVYMIPDSKFAVDSENQDNCGQKLIFALLCKECLEEKHKGINGQIPNARSYRLVERKLPIHLVVQLLEKNIMDVPLGQPSFADSRYTSYPLNTDDFHPLPKLTRERKIAFVDGGSAEIIGAPNFAVGLTRLYFVVFKGDQRIEPVELPQMIEFYVICFARTRSNQIVYKTLLVPVKEEWVKYLPDVSDLEFNSFDQTLMSGGQRVIVSRILDVTRTFSEWRFSKFVIESELDRGDILVRDGSLQTTVTNESKYSNDAYEAALKKGIFFTALSKTSTLFTDSGLPLFPSIQILSETSALKDLAWYYFPIVDINHADHRAEMFAVKLHRNSDYVFRFEVLKDQVSKKNMGEAELIFSALAENSIDLGFPGYPYGLIDADRFARISMNEKAANEFQFRAALSSQKQTWDKISKFVRASDAHEILNKLR